MNNNTKANIVTFIIVTIIWYLLGSLFAWNFNPGNWHWLLRTIIGMAWLISIARTID